MLKRARRRGLLLLAFAGLGLAACGPANERPASGAFPGSRSAATPPGAPPTLTASEALRFRALPTPSPGVPAAGPATSPSLAASPAVVASPSTVAEPPIVRTISPGANGHVTAGTVNVSAVLVGRGADLATATLSINGAAAEARIDKRSTRDWTIHASQALANGTHTVRVFVRDSSGAAGGFTWQFAAGEPEPVAPAEPAAPVGSPVPQPRRP